MFEQRNQQVRTDTTRHLGADGGDEAIKGITGYLEGARKRSSRFVKSTMRLREIRSEIDTMSRDVRGRPTGILSGGDVDIAYHYLIMGLGVFALLYSILGTVFALHGGGAVFLSAFLERWAVSPMAALIDTATQPQTIIALILQAVVFIVMVGTRRVRQSWQHWAAVICSVALTYAGWSPLLLNYGMPILLSLAAIIPAALIGGALGWVVVLISNDNAPSRSLLLGVIAIGVVVGSLGLVSLTHWAGLLLAWSVDQVSRRLIVIG
ncbi:MAG: hypothetical protein HGA19_02160 [Oscillochloris sp.]|nr:hypothetical protein [Oscillochloris sp.]